MGALLPAVGSNTALSTRIRPWYVTSPWSTEPALRSHSNVPEYPHLHRIWKGLRQSHGTNVSGLRKWPLQCAQHLSARPCAVACWLFKPFSPAARRTRPFRGGAVCTRLEHTSLGVHIALRAHPSLVSIAVSLQVLHSGAVENFSHRIVQCVQGSRFRSLPTVPRTLPKRLDIPIELLEQTVHLLHRCSHRPTCPKCR